MVAGVLSCIGVILIDTFEGKKFKLERSNKTISHRMSTIGENSQNTDMIFVAVSLSVIIRDEIM